MRPQSGWRHSSSGRIAAIAASSAPNASIRSSVYNSIGIYSPAFPLPFANA